MRGEEEPGKEEIKRPLAATNLATYSGRELNEKVCVGHWHCSLTHINH